jgi:hypothetical protein
MPFLHYLWKQNKKNHKIVEGHYNKNSIQDAEHNTKLSETTSTNKWNKSGFYQMNGLRYSPKWVRQIGRAFHTRYKNMYKKLETIMQDQIMT